ncbi:GNAT family N-acetyltransferase [Brevibacillus sp. SIMBA_040]|uniref:GNAT family N-acetyltransferase n=1 Tax=unclassified Brevibacillus TaxID=2684853 RepID=UPI003978B58F
MYRKELYVFEGEKPRRAAIRNYTQSDFFELIQIQAESFPPPYPSEQWWNQEQLTNHVTLFPEGAICVEIDGVLAGSMTALIVSFDPSHPEHSWGEVTDNGYIRNHNPNGDTLYIVDLCIRPSHRKLGLGQLMMQAMYELVVHKGLKRLLGGGRMPGYGRHADTLTSEQYLEKIVSGELKDPVISFLMRCGRTPVQAVTNYLEDEESRNCAALMEWKNPFQSQ